MKNIFLNKKVLVAGGTGMVGQQLVKRLLKKGAIVSVASMDDKKLVNTKITKFYNCDLIYLSNCFKITKDIDIVFNLLGVTGSPKINIERPGSFMMSNLYCAINLLYASQKNHVKRYLYTSTYGVYNNNLKMIENNVWKSYPSEHDKYAGWAKRMGELQVEAYSKEFDFKSLHVVRPANIYGPYLNFNPKNSMVVASLIRRITEGENPLKIWGDGKNIRDFIYSDDVALAMIAVMEKNIQIPINIGSGKGVTIKNLVNAIINNKRIKNKPKIIFDKNKPSGDKKRVLDTKLLNKHNIYPRQSLESGLDKTIKWYLENFKKPIKKYNYFE